MADSQYVKHDHNDHIVRTKEQWEDRAIANYAIPRGVLCIELTSKTETRLKIGEGDKFYKQLPYVGGDSGDLSNYYTKQEVDNIIANLNFMSIASTRIYDSKSQLPLNGNKLGDLRFVRGEKPTDDPFEYLWNGNKWIQIGGYADIDLSKYVTREEIMPRIQNLERSSHTHSNKSILDQITAAYTAEEKTKLTELENYDDTEIKQDISELQSQAHTHINKSILDQTTAPFTREEKQKLEGLHDYDDFIGTDGTQDGQHGLVPAPQATDANKYLSSDGTWKPVSAGGIEPATRSTLGGVIIGTGVNVEQDGTISVDEYDDTEIKQDISELQSQAHTHANKSVLDNTTAAYTTEEKTKLEGLHNYELPEATSQVLGGVKIGENVHVTPDGTISVDEYDDTEIKQDIVELQSQAHTHSNKSVLDNTTASYTTEEKTKLAGLENYTLPVASDTTLGGIKVGSGLSIASDGTLNANAGTDYIAGDGISIDNTQVAGEKQITNTGVLDINKNQDGDLVVSSIEGDKVIVIPSGESGDYRAGNGIEIVEQTEPTVVEIDISDGWVNKVVTSAGSRSSMDDNKTYMRFRYPCTPGQKFKLRFTPSNATDVVYFNVFGFSSDSANSGGQKMYPVDGDWSTDQTAEITVLAGYPSVDFTIRLNNPGWGQGSNITAASFSEMVMIIEEDVPVGAKYINVKPATTQTIGGVIVGSGLTVTSEGVLNATAGTEYAAGNGISIDQGSTEASDITELQWEQGSINPVNGEPDDFTTTVIRSPMIEVGLTNMLNVSAQATDNSDMLWKAAFYDSNDRFISMTSSWNTLSDGVTRPANATHVIIVLRKDAETEIDENTLLSCEISWPIEIGKYVITNTGVTHAELESSSVIVTENGETKTLFSFGQDLDVTNGVVSIPDYNRLVLNVEE